MLALESGVAIFRLSWQGRTYVSAPAYRRLSSLRLTRSLNFLLLEEGTQTRQSTLPLNLLDHLCSNSESIHSGGVNFITDAGFLRSDDGAA